MFLKPQSAATAVAVITTVDRCTYLYGKHCLQVLVVDALGFWGRETEMLSFLYMLER